MAARKPQELRDIDAKLAKDAPNALDGLARLMEIMRRLRDPEHGCPWDAVQSYDTIAPYTIDEAYEVADAIARGATDDLCDELGDLQLQVVYHAQIATERGDFDLTDVMRAVCEKMIRRHPHVFGDAEETPGWEAIKAEERRLKAARKAATQAPEDGGAPASILADTPVALPALARAVELQKRAAKVGFDWPDIEPVLDKISEESRELAEARMAELAGDADMATREARRTAVTEEFGDLLFVMANLARWMKIDPEDALRRANAKFTRRFGAVERGLAAVGRAPGEATLEEMDALWDAEKARERQANPKHGDDS